MITFRLAFLDKLASNRAVCITSTTYQVTLESLALRGELEVVNEVHRNHTMVRQVQWLEGTTDGTVTETFHLHRYAFHRHLCSFLVITQCGCSALVFMSKYKW
jgi:hypothetical protein